MIPYLLQILYLLYSFIHYLLRFEETLTKQSQIQFPYIWKDTDRPIEKSYRIRIKNREDYHEGTDMFSIRV